ncbi:hypothetical protein AURDEDRAFT_110116 [Auricularia subglabra TFB-10046 SS5]|nr:hypothetical protein AURDEDRAFT_110116 [Auricularia subglabra TFB-10046 SS5]
MSDPSMYQFQLDWDFPANGFARTYAYSGRWGGACGRAGMRSRFWWLLLGAGATYWWMRSSQQRKAIKDAEAKRRVAARKERKVREEWVLRLTREVVPDDDGASVDSELDDELVTTVKTRKINLGEEAAGAVADILEVSLDSISVFVDRLKAKLAQRRAQGLPDSDFSPITVQEAQASA